MPSCLKIGQRIKTGQNEWEVSDLDYDDSAELVVRVHSVDGQFARHIKSGRDYVAFRHLGVRYPEEEVWEIPPEDLKDASRRVQLHVKAAQPKLELVDD